MGIEHSAASRPGERLMDTLLGQSTELVLLIDKQGIIRYTNSAVERALGWKADEMIGRPRYDFVLAEKRKDFIQMNGQFPANTSLELHERWKHADGTVRYLDGKVTNLVDDPDISGYLKTLRERPGPSVPADILSKADSELQSELDRTKKALSASEKKFQLLFEESPVPMWVIDPETLRFMQVNKAAREFYGYEEAEFTKMTLLDIRPPQGHTFSHFMKYERYSYGTWIHMKKDGTVVAVEGISNPIDWNGKTARLSLIKDITRHLEAEEALVDANERFRLAAEAVSSLIYEWNVSTSTVLRSAMLRALTGYDPADTNIQNPEWWTEQIHPEDRESYQATLKAAIASHSNFSAEYRIRHQDGRYIYLWDRGLVVRDDRGQATRVVGSAQDITERRQMEAQLEQERFVALLARDQAEEMNRLKTSFLANISHEIRTPMTAILGFASVLSETVPDKESAEYASMILTSGTRLLRTINGILDLARSESSAFKLHPTPIDVIPEARRVVRMLDPLASPKGIALKFETSLPMLPAVLDPGYLAQVITNLVGNAVKFTTTGSVTVTLLRPGADVPAPAAEQASYRTSDFPHDDHFVITCIDTGIGISDDFLPHIFEEFKQESSGYNREFEGTGLGLTITSRIVKAMGGSIEVWSKRGEGSTFVVRLPYGVAAGKPTVTPLPEPKMPLPASQTVSLDKSLNVLLVEDTYETAQLVKHFLRKESNIMWAKDGMTAISMAADHSFDLILMDVNLGEGLSGLEVTRYLRAQTHTKTTPIIALTAYAMEEEDSKKALDAGCSGYLSKPFQRDGLYEAIKKVLDKA
jgi:PAS domain S-box-containing protein